MRFRKKPIEIEAWQYDATLVEDQRGVCRCETGNGNGPHLHTMHLVARSDDGREIYQTVFLQPGDWIVPEPDGTHYYPIKPIVFANTYDPVDG